MDKKVMLVLIFQVFWLYPSLQDEEFLLLHLHGRRVTRVRYSGWNFAGVDRRAIECAYEVMDIQHFGRSAVYRSGRIGTRV